MRISVDAQYQKRIITYSNTYCFKHKISFLSHRWIPYTPSLSYLKPMSFKSMCIRIKNDSIYFQKTECKSSFVIQICPGAVTPFLAANRVWQLTKLVYDSVYRCALMTVTQIKWQVLVNYSETRSFNGELYFTKSIPWENIG